MTRLLVAGLNVRPVALSAVHAGYDVSVVDFFGDVDLTREVSDVHSIGGEYSAERLCERAVEVAKANKPDGVLLTSELGGNPEYVREIEGVSPVLGNDSARVSGVRDWAPFFRKLDGLGVAHPETFVVEGEDEAEEASESLGYPLVVKPVHGSAGFGVALAENRKDVLAHLKEYGRILVQEYIEGVDASVSLLGDGKSAQAVSFNKQLLGLPMLGCTKRFQYCGNLVPFEHGTREEAVEAAEKVCTVFGLLGSVGIDFVLADKPYLIEVNPRFADTLECVERAYGINLVEEHVRACGGERWAFTQKPSRVWCKGILYADRDLTVDGDLTHIENCVDIYLPETKVSADEPVCSAIASGETEKQALKNLEKKIEEIKTQLSYK